MTDEFEIATAITAGTWFLLAALIGYWASSKGRSGLLFFIASLILTPLVAAFAVVLMPADRVAVERRLLRGGAMKKCANCAELIKSEAQVCRFCGNSFLPASERR
jgi:uncharacterized membrane protein YcfT